MNYELGLYEKAMPSALTWEEKFATVKRNGFNYLEMSIDETDSKLARLDMSDEELANILHSSYSWGVPIGSICLSAHRKYPLGSKNTDIIVRSLEIMEKVLILAVKLGVRTIQLAGYDVYYEDSDEITVKNFENNLLKCVDLAAKYGVNLGFETMENEFMNTVSKAMKYVGKVDSAYLGVYPDVGNITNAARTYMTSEVDDLKSGKGHLIAMHLKETTPGVFREVKFGTGHVDFLSVIQEGYALGVRRFVVEMWYVGQDDWEDDIAEAYRFISGFFHNVV